MTPGQATTAGGTAVFETAFTCTSDIGPGLHEVTVTFLLEDPDTAESLGEISATVNVDVR